jgi:hypothetical protein
MATAAAPMDGLPSSSSEAGVVCLIAKVGDEADQQPECGDDRDAEKPTEQQIRQNPWPWGSALPACSFRVGALVRRLGAFWPWPAEHLSPLHLAEVGELDLRIREPA